MCESLDSATCCRCGRTISVLDDEFILWAELDDGDRLVCDGCLTAEEQRRVDAEFSKWVVEVASRDPAFVAGAIEGLEQRFGEPL